MARGGEAGGPWGRHGGCMQAEFVRVRGGEITIRRLARGDTATIQAVFGGLSARSRQARFGGAKNVLTAAELECFARVDGSHDVLVAGAGLAAVGVARLARDPSDPRFADVAVAVVDEWQARGVGGGADGAPVGKRPSRGHHTPESNAERGERRVAGADAPCNDDRADAPPARRPRDRRPRRSAAPIQPDLAKEPSRSASADTTSDPIARRRAKIESR